MIVPGLAPDIVVRAIEGAAREPSSPLAVMVEGLALGALAFVLGLIIGAPFIRALRRYGVGKKIRIEGPESHLAKTGTPTMGGLIVMLVVVVVTAAFNLVGRWSMLLPLGVILACGVLGAADDLLNLAKGQKSGLTARFKMAWLLAIGLAAAVVLHFQLGLSSVYLPFIGKTSIGYWYIPVAVFTIVAFANAVNLTDGLDTLAGGTIAIAFMAYGVIAFLQGQDYVVTLSFTLVGAILAFLWYNAHPAMVFMGDTGSLALGATLAVVALMTGHWLLLPVVGAVFVAETLSVTLQVLYFKARKGKRLFRMSPLHHHFELLGWAETQVTMRFWLISMACAMAGVALALF